MDIRLARRHAGDHALTADAGHGAVFTDPHPVVLTGLGPDVRRERVLFADSDGDGGLVQREADGQLRALLRRGDDQPIAARRVGGGADADIILLSGAQVSPRAMTALYAGLLLILNLVCAFTGEGILSTFVSILTSLLSVLLGAGFAMYCMAIRRGERAEYLTLFDGFSFVGKLIALTIVTYAFIWLWSMLFVIPGIIAALRYAMTPYIMAEHPELTASEAINRSKELMEGHKMDLFILQLTFLGWEILCALTLNLGNLALNPYKNAAITVFYRHITSQNRVEM